MEKNKRTKIIMLILVILLSLIALIFLIDGILGYKQHKCNQEYIHPNDVTMWTCKEINMKITYDNNSDIIFDGGKSIEEINIKIAVRDTGADVCRSDNDLR